MNKSENESIVVVHSSLCLGNYRLTTHQLNPLPTHSNLLMKFSPLTDWLALPDRRDALRVPRERIKHQGSKREKPRGVKVKITQRKRERIFSHLRLR